MISLREITEEYLGSLRFVKEIKREFEFIETSDITAVLGPRRVGKTFILLKRANQLLERGEQVIFVSMDDPIMHRMSVRELSALARKEYPSGKIFLFLDEVQEWVDWDYNLRWLHDVKDFYLIVSGSSSILTQDNVPSRLRGRYISIQIYPLSFREVVGRISGGFRGKGRIQSLLEDYIKWGGFPEVWLYRSREKIISLMETIFYRDIIERHKIKDTGVFRTIFYHLLQNYANSHTYRSLQRLLESQDARVDVKTLINYLEYMREAFLLYIVEKYSPSYRTRDASPKKLYLVDTSLTTLMEQPMSLGRKIENIVYIELLRRKDPLTNIYYYMTRNNQEIDFLIVKTGRPQQLIETTYELEPSHTKRILAAMEELGIKKSTIITWNQEDMVKRNDKTIEIKPLWKWLLEKTKCNKKYGKKE